MNATGELSATLALQHVDDEDDWLVRFVSSDTLCPTRKHSHLGC